MRGRLEFQKIGLKGEVRVTGSPAESSLKTPWCKAGNGVKITISCDDHIPGTEVESCLGIFSEKKHIFL